MTFVIATISYALLITGLLLRRQKLLHIPCMLSAMLLDVSLTIFLEIQRSALNKALSLEMTPFQQIHIGASTLALILYVPTVFYGILRLKNQSRLKKINSRHKRLGLLAFTFRTIGFIFMFSLLD